MVNLCYLTGLFDNSCLAEWCANIQKTRSCFEFCLSCWLDSAAWSLCGLTDTHINTCSHGRTNTQAQTEDFSLISLQRRGREGCRLWRSGEGLMGSREVQARWLKTQATDVSGTLQSGAPASASTGHDALLRWCPPGTWRWHHMAGPPGTMQSRGWHFGSHLPTQTQLPVRWRASGEAAHMLNADLKGTKLGHVRFVNLASWMKSGEAGNVLVKHCNAFPLLGCLYVE